MNPCLGVFNDPELFIIEYRVGVPKVIDDADTVSHCIKLPHNLIFVKSFFLLDFRPRLCYSQDMKLKQLSAQLDELTTLYARRQTLTARGRHEALNQDEQTEFTIMTNRIAELEETEV